MNKGQRFWPQKVTWRYLQMHFEIWWGRSTTSLELKLSTEFDLSPSYNGKAHKSILGWDSIPAQEQLSPSGVQGNVRQWWIKQTHLSSPLLAGQKSQVGFILPYFSVAFFLFFFSLLPHFSIFFFLSVVARSLFLSLLAELTAWSIDSSQSMLSSWESPSLVTQNKDIRNKTHTCSLSLSSLLVTSVLVYKNEEGGSDGPLPDTEYQCWQRAVLWEGCNNVTNTPVTFRPPQWNAPVHGLFSSSRYPSFSFTLTLMSRRSLSISSFGSETVNNIKPQLNIHNERFQDGLQKQTFIVTIETILFDH